MKVLDKNKSDSNKRRYFFNEKLWKIIITGIAVAVIVLTVAIGIFLLTQGSETFIKFGHSVFEFLFTSDWSPKDSQDGGGSVGALIFIWGSLYTCILALVIVTPFSIAAAIFITEISPKFGGKIIQPAVEMFVGIPSVIYGWVGYELLCKWIKTAFPVEAPTGMSVLAGAIVLAIMIFPTITTVVADALRNVPPDYRAASLALGTTRWQTIKKIVLPAAKQGLLTGIVLGLARAFGEALAVAFVIGRVREFAFSIFSPTYNITALIAAEMGEAMNGSEKKAALWSLALLLFLISMLFIFIIHLIGKKGKANEKRG